MLSPPALALAPVDGPFPLRDQLLDDDDDVDEDGDVEGLLWAAQMDFIGHRNSQAVAKLHQAVALRSSAACVTLGNLLARGVRDPNRPQAPMSSPTFATGSAQGPPIWASPPPPLAQQSHERNGRTAAELFITGLEIELAKPVDTAARSTRSAGSSAAVAASSITGESESEEDSAEGTNFSLERTLDLVVGLTNCYRFGVLSPDEPTDTARETLWTRGARSAAETLRHQLIAPARSAIGSFSHSASTIMHPAAQTAAASVVKGAASPRSASVERSYAHPSTSVPSPSFFPSTNHSQNLVIISPQTKHRLTVQVHLLYLLALQAYPANRAESEHYWAEILQLANNTGGTIGTKEGNDIVASAQRRLQASLHAESDQSWKLSKLKKKTTPVSPSESAGMRKGKKGSASGDALVDMWFERRAFVGEKGKGRETAVAAEDDDSSTITLHPGTQKWTHMSDRVRSPVVTGPAGVGKALNVEQSTSAVAPRNLGKLPGFQLGTPADYPESPPYTPIPSPPISLVVPSSPADSPTRALATHLRQPSTASVPHPTFTHLLRRTGSIACLSKPLKADLFSTKVRNPAAKRDWRSSAQASESDPTLLPAVLAVLRSTHGFWRVLASNLNPFKPARAPSAVATLRLALVRDEQCGMEWADSSDVETEEVYEQVLEREPECEDEDKPVFAPVASGSGTTRRTRHKDARRPAVTQRRSFIDVTSHSSHASSLSPRIVCTPPSPDPRSSYLADVGVDPLLLELERRSRVGVKTVCVTCGKRGLNFPAVKTGETYCSRTCRLGPSPS